MSHYLISFCSLMLSEKAWACGLKVSAGNPTKLTAAELREIHTFSISVLDEPFESFRLSALWHDIIYVFKESESNRMVGISFWRHESIELPNGMGRIKVIVQGKLRILASYRRLSLHVWATLWYWFQLQIQYPWERIWFISIASLFNYVSMRKSVSKYYVMDGNYAGNVDLEALHRYTKIMIAHDNFEFDVGSSCRVNVFIKIDKKTLSEFPKSFYEMPESQDYIKANPRYSLSSFLLSELIVEYQICGRL
jgi:hypothetical protein